METLPAEMVLKIGQLLTVEELTRCCGVSRGWREAFNQDRLWRRHCDTTLEEYLRTTPPVVEPAFVIPGDEGTTLEPICRWRVAFLREKHLRNNWKHNYHRTESLMDLKNELYREFLSNTLIVRWLTDCAEVWDVSKDPATFVARTDPSDSIEEWIDCYVGKDALIVRQFGSVKVFSVDIINRSIQLKQNILLEDVGTVPVNSDYHQHLQSFKKRQQSEKSKLDCVKGNLFIHINARRSNLDIFDLETGLKVKEEACPVPVVNNIALPVEIMEVMTSQTCDIVITIVRSVNQAGLGSRYCYRYNPQKLSFSQGCIVLRIEHYCELYSHYLAVAPAGAENQTIRIFDCRSFKRVLKTTGKFKIGFYKQGSEEYFMLRKSEKELEMYNLKTRTIKTITTPMTTGGLRGVSWPGGSRNFAIMPGRSGLLVFDNQLLAYYNSSYWYLMADDEWVKSDLTFDESLINQASTKMLSNGTTQLHDYPPMTPTRSGYRLKEWYIYHMW